MPIPVTTRRSIARRPLVAVLALALLGVPAVALASHQFTDVPSSHIFHSQIDRLVDAGITGGCGAGTYCPSSPVNRGQMAAFLNRGLGRTSAADGTISFANAASTYVAETTITTGGIGSGIGFVLVTASASGYTNEPGVCPCEMAVYAVSPDGDFSPAVYDDISDTPTPTGFRNGTGSVSWVFPAPSGTSQTYSLAVDIDGTGTLVGGIEGSITATYFPFGADGGSALGTAAGADGDIGRPGPTR